MMSKISKFLTKRNIIYAALALLVIVFIFLKVSGGNGKETVAVTRGDVVQEVAATGKVTPSQEVNLGFDKSGRVGAVYKKVGDFVRQGEIIAVLESGEVSADIAKAESLLQEEIIKLREIQNTAPNSYNDALKSLETAIKEGFIDADTAVRNKADQFFKNTSSNPQFEVSITSGNYVHYFNVPSDIKLAINNDRVKVENILLAWQRSVEDPNKNNVLTRANKAIEDLGTISVFLNKVAEAINTFTPAEFTYESTVSSYKSTIAAARTDVSGAISAIVTAKDKLNNAPTLGQNGQFENVLVQEAKVNQARASLASLEANFGKSVIRAPFDGVLTVQDAKMGATVSAGTTLVSAISNNQMYIEANISEINIGKVSQNDKVLITFDAFPGEVFNGFVSYIEPGDLVIDGVVNYKIRVELGEVIVAENGQQIMRFDNTDQKIKSGLTANLKIETNKKESVSVLPLYAITKEAGQNFVNKISDGKVQKVPVDLGLIGNNGLAEIISGLSEGETVLVESK